MANENLRQALQQAALTPDDLAQIVGVDVRTVRRWLSGGTPYPRQRANVARALDTTEHDLWPDIATPAPTPAAPRAGDLIAVYPTASDLAAPDWKRLMRDATERIDLLGATLGPILDTPGVPELLASKAANGCHVRILASYPQPNLSPLLDCAGIEIRVLDVPEHQTTYRFDDQLLVLLQLDDPGGQDAPLLHLRHAGPRGLFERFTEHYKDLWEHVAQPLDPEIHLYEDDEDDRDDVVDDDATTQPVEPADNASTPPTRRWPRRPS